MYIRSLNREQLDYLFQQYKEIPHLNQFDFLLKPAQKQIDPIYKVYEDEKGKYDPIPLGRLNVSMEADVHEEDIESKKYPPQKGTRATLIASGKLLENAKKLFIPQQGAVVSYIAGRGRLQAHQPRLTSQMLQAYYDLLNRIVKTELGLPGYIVGNVALESGFSFQKRIVRHTIWLEDLFDGTEMANEMQSRGERAIGNFARLSGLVYMPPSLGRDNLHFRVRIRRKKIEGEYYPKDYWSKEGHDYLNVIIPGKAESEDAFFRIKQGHPIYVEGFVHANLYWHPFSLENKNKVAEMLGVDKDSSQMREIADFFQPVNKDFRPSTMIPSLYVYATRVVTNPDQIMIEAKDGWSSEKQKKEEDDETED